MWDVRACGMGGKHVDETKARGHVLMHGCLMIHIKFKNVGYAFKYIGNKTLQHVDVVELPPGFETDDDAAPE